jgi:hypothetical protein
MTGKWCFGKDLKGIIKLLSVWNEISSQEHAGGSRSISSSIHIRILAGNEG